MKLLHISDLHIGKRVNGISMIDDQKHILAQIVAIASSEKVDALVIAGDIYDKASPSAEAVTVFDSFLVQLSDADIRVLAVPGNHDSAERIAYAQGLLANQGVCFPPVFAGEIEKVELEDEHGTVAIWLVPFLKPGDVRRFFPERDIGDDYSAALTAVLDSCEIDRSIRNVAVSHQLVTAFGKSPDRADDEIKLGGIDNVDVSVYDAFDYVALGHVHRPQRIGRDTVRYSGSPLKYSFSEARYDKSAVLVELGRKAAAGTDDGDETSATGVVKSGTADGDVTSAASAADVADESEGCVSFKLIPLEPLHDMREIRMTLQDVLAAGASEGEDAHDYVHVTLTDEHPQLDAMAKIRDVYPNAMALDYDNIAKVVQRKKVRAAVDPDETDTVELFAQFYEEQMQKPMDDEQNAIVEKVVRSVESAQASGQRGDAR